MIILAHSIQYAHRLKGTRINARVAKEAILHTLFAILYFPQPSVSYRISAPENATQAKRAVLIKNGINPTVIIVCEDTDHSCCLFFLF